MDKINEFAHYAGKLDKKCEHCKALFFGCEGKVYRGKYIFNSCCQNGTVKLPIIKTPTELKTILQTKGFLKNIRRYNDLFAFSRNFTKYDMFLLSRHEVLDRYTLKMRGKVSHSTPPTLYPISQNVNV